MYSNHHYNKELKHYARELRSETVSKAEKFIWKALLSRKKTGERFLRQRPIKYFIVDFFCPNLGLIIEIDGSSHYSKAQYDYQRQQYLLGLGYTILRFSEGQVLNQLQDVEYQIMHAIGCLREERNGL